MSTPKGSGWTGRWKIAGLIMVVIVSLAIIMSGVIRGETLKNGDLRILKSEVKSIAKFYPYKAGGIKMEVIAVRASDGTIRTAFNTCQVCFNSGRGYYTQQADELVCFNCGNRFQIDKVEKIKYGCNPIPIMKPNKTEDGKYITISKDFLMENKDYFANWRK